ncbi:TetR/AcrR family transcriptional regulator [Rhizobium laguerreae]|uniref:TetR/AcrR family transcriptional regulator n=1 Tax=Rhizobium laguerreae TaxID=1076926 RepID=UPI001C91BD42|nr:TetR/AcrR family transcriptional regulator [Rhizobium laguerreae]MBY3150901.1 TetR/AcrR family transcriptional regulator [Rhizobium laguerreae]
MPAISQEKIDARKESIIDAAEAQITRSGLSSVSARTVAKAAGCSTSLIYVHFDNFDEVILRANSRFIAKLDAALAEASIPSASVADRYVALALTYLRVGLEHRRQWAALFEHRMADGRPLPDWHLAEHLYMFRHIADPLRELAPKLSEAERYSLARAIYSAVHGLVSLGIETRLGQVPVEELKRQLTLIVSSLVAGLGTTLQR